MKFHFRLNLAFSLVIASLSVASLAPVAPAAEKKIFVEGLENPESVAASQDGRLYVTVIGKSGTDGDGTVAVIEGGKARTFAKGMDDPKGLVAYEDDLFVADKTRVWKIDSNGTATVYADADAFPIKPKFLNDIEAGPQGDIFVSDCGTFVSDAAVYRIKPTKEIDVVVSQKTAPQLKAANGLLADGDSSLLVADFTTGKLYRLNLKDRKLAEVASGFGGADGLARDAKQQVYVSDWKGGRVFIVDGQKAKLFADGFQAAADILFDAKSGKLLVPDMKAGNIAAIEVD